VLHKYSIITIQSFGVAANNTLLSHKEIKENDRCVTQISQFKQLLMQIQIIWRK